jgi:hypothetical protein
VLLELWCTEDHDMNFPVLDPAGIGVITQHRRL